MRLTQCLVRLIMFDSNDQQDVEVIIHDSLDRFVDRAVLVKRVESSAMGVSGSPFG